MNELVYVLAAAGVGAVIGGDAKGVGKWLRARVQSWGVIYTAACCPRCVAFWVGLVLGLAATSWWEAPLIGLAAFAVVRVGGVNGVVRRKAATASRGDRDPNADRPRASRGDRPGGCRGGC